MTENRTFENENIRLEIRGDIVFGWYKGGMFDLDMAKDAVKKRKEFTNYQRVRMIASESGFKGFTREARQYLSSDEGQEGLIAGAIVTKSVFASHLANIFIKISFVKSNIPIRMFTNEEEAIKWLREQKE
ncbi:hypothetical protein K6119_15595 [Paracrocinitomix mangrovi]|uniref:DUF7793 family protein n=1 Tax=Paracrocinitomix mangrovi TaxID=2862509 RepID=UPI001C8E6A50|nr:hypothetical protein [Paracrocinitomix mangrovi]UKN01153.1 hypothetical protein K6119_15595 [Paracrocinitomix mangrovi]